MDDKFNQRNNIAPIEAYNPSKAFKQEDSDVEDSDTFAKLFGDGGKLEANILDDLTTNVSNKIK